MGTAACLSNTAPCTLQLSGHKMNDEYEDIPAHAGGTTCLAFSPRQVVHIFVGYMEKPDRNEYGMDSAFHCV